MKAIEKRLWLMPHSQNPVPYFANKALGLRKMRHSEAEVVRGLEGIQEASKRRDEVKEATAERLQDFKGESPQEE